MPVTLQGDEALVKACAASLLSLREATVEEGCHSDSSVLGTSQDPLPGQAVTTGTNREAIGNPPRSSADCLSTDVEAAPRVSDGSLESTDLVTQPPTATEHMNDAHTDDNSRPALAPEAINLTQDEDELEVVSGNDTVESGGDSQCQDLAPEVIDLTQDDDELEVSGNCPIESRGDSRHQDLAPEVIDLTQDDDDLEVVPRKLLKRKRDRSVEIYRSSTHSGRRGSFKDVYVKAESK